MRRGLLLIVLPYLITLAAVAPCAAQGGLPAGFWDHGGFDADVPYDPPILPTIPLATYDFEGCSQQGWTTHDHRDQAVYFHVDNFAGLSAPYTPLADSKSLWCGARAATTEPLCGYATLPGYGNNWDQRWTTKTCLALTGAVTVTFTAQWDIEAGYDYAVVEFDDCADNWTPVTGTIGSPNVTGIGGPVVATFSFSGHTGNGHVRIRVVTDGTWSDEDGLWPTSGAIEVDELRVDDAGGVVVPNEDFEGEAIGATESNDWQASVPEFGNYAAVVLGSTEDQDDPHWQDLTCLWAFTQGPVNNYSCGHGSLAAVPMGPINGLYMNDEIWSPAIAFSGPATYGTFLKFDVYKELPFDNLVFYQWWVREKLIGESCWGRWGDNNFVYYSDDHLWHTQANDLTPYLSPSSTISQIQVAISVIDMAPLWTGTLGTGACHSHAPLIDNVSVYRYPGGRAAVPLSLTLFQDRFPGDGTLTGTVRMDGIEGDQLRILIADADAPIDYLTPGVPASGPAVFLHVKNLANKSGSVISGGVQWPYVQSLSDQTWSVLQMSEGTGEHEYDVDLNDQLYQPGDVVEYYISSRDANGEWSYWSYFTGTADEATVQSYPMEVSCLPTPPQQGQPRALYVDACSGLGAQPLVESAMASLGMKWDRYDRNEPLMGKDNSLGNWLTNPDFLQDYNVIVWDTGNLSNPFNDVDYSVMDYYLEYTQNARLLLCGTQAAKAIATSTDPAADYLRTKFMQFALITDDQRTIGLPLSPLVTGVAQGPFEGQFYAFSEEGTPGTFDVMTTSGSSKIGMYYGASPNSGALLYEDAVGKSGLSKVVLAGFSLSSIRDDVPGNAPGKMVASSPVPDRTQLLDKIMQYFGTSPGVPTGTPPVVRDFLAQNEPNPFNPTTTIRYALSIPGRVSLRIYDVNGALVRTLVDDSRKSVGSAQAVWDGRDDRGVPVASGVYFYRIATPSLTATKKMVLLK